MHMQLAGGQRTAIKPRPLFSRRRFLRSTIISLTVVTLLLSIAGGAYAQTLHNRFRAAASNTAVTIYKGNNFRTGQYPNETILNTSNVNATQFGLHISYPVEGQVFAQPLYVPNLTINGGRHNVVFVETEHDSAYAFDADQRGSAIAPLWQRSFIDPAHGITTISSSVVNCDDIYPEYGITGTPVINTSTNTMYVVVDTLENGTNIYRIHALNITTGADKPGSPVVIAATITGSGAGNVNGVISFDPTHEKQRGSLLLLNRMVYVTFASYCDIDVYHGWIISYDAATLQRSQVYNDSRDGERAGIWSSGAGPAADTHGNIYFMTGNGTFDLNTGGPDAGDSIVKLSSTLTSESSFTPFNQQCLADGDVDLGSGGVLLLPDKGELIGVGKEGRIYVASRGSLGGYNTIPNACNNQNLTNVDKVLQELPPNTAAGGIWSTPAYWSGPTGEYIYTIGSADTVKAFHLHKGLLSPTPSSVSPESFGYPGGNPVVSSNGATAGTGILWTIDPIGVLRAYDATNLATELFSSSNLPSYVKFSVPTVANGEVFVGTQSTLEIFGLLH